jgi:hypothetical protein
MLTTHRLAVLVSKHDVVINLDSALWNDPAVNPQHAHYALVPVKQSLRLVIHDYLLDCGKLVSGSENVEEVKQIDQTPSAVSAAPLVVETTAVEEAVVVPVPSVVVADTAPITTAQTPFMSAPIVDSFVLDGKEGPMDHARLKKLAANGEVTHLECNLFWFISRLTDNAFSFRSLA